jgi:hypothetical protein
MSHFPSPDKLLTFQVQIITSKPEIPMPRLLGKPSKAPLYIGTALVIAVAGASVLEYYGVIDIVPNFGKDQKMMGRSKLPTDKGFERSQ